MPFPSDTGGCAASEAFPKPDDRPEPPSVFERTELDAQAEAAELAWWAEHDWRDDG